MSIKRSPTIVTLGCPTVECNWQLSINISDINYVSINNCHVPTPALAKNSAAKDPTPPRPTTNTFAFAIYPNLFLK
jgi:hypothetical protein